MSSWLVVGISGVTNGGKSTLAQQLQSRLPTHTQVISQDDYFYPKDSQYHVPCPGGLAHHNWDIISALDMKKMVCDVMEIVKSHPDQNDSSHKGGTGSPLSEEVGLRPVLLMDGFILYDDPEILELCDLRYFFTLTQEECWERRSQRTYDPPDPPGYFEACVWPMYEEHLVKVKEGVPNVVFLDGMEENLSAVLQQVTAAARLKGKKYPGAILG
ncbi:nicotinamide riboside kinase 1-like [Scylla paramamosain]|uniref:nicotinamide riboside kinase 1-like n=1 Tax=Scylla paramamosain TaxID=85552 RepID=UPI003083D133